MRQTNSRPTKGRPKLPAEERKSILVSVKLDIDQYKEITNKAFIAGLNHSEYMRHAINPRLKNTVGHISLNFHADDKDKISDKKMVEIARKYMDRMGIVDTPYIIVRHLDKDYPHCHIVFSRINNYGETISDKNDFERNKDICLDLTKEYGLHISDSKRQTNVNKLRGNEKIRYEIFNAVDEAWNDNSISTFSKFEAKLKASGVGVEYKFK